MCACLCPPPPARPGGLRGSAHLPACSYVELSTLASYGWAAWLTSWNVLDTLLYVCQVLITVLHLRDQTRLLTGTTPYQALLALQVRPGSVRGGEMSSGAECAYTLLWLYANSYMHVHRATDVCTGRPAVWSVECGVCGVCGVGGGMLRSVRCAARRR